METPKVHRRQHRHEKRLVSRRSEQNADPETTSPHLRASPTRRITPVSPQQPSTSSSVLHANMTSEDVKVEESERSADTNDPTVEDIQPEPFLHTISNSDDRPVTSASNICPEVLVNGHAAEGKETNAIPSTMQRCKTEKARRGHSPDSMSLRSTILQYTGPLQGKSQSISKGIMGFMDKEFKASIQKRTQSLSDPQASPAQRSTRSRNSLDKSPRRKRSKSESRRRRERKLIAAGEMEVRQANETLMRYLKQCSEMNDASLSGELEIDHKYDERKVHRKTKSQRDKRGHLISKLYTAGALPSILKELSDDIVPADGEEIYNPFTPVVSPTEESSHRIDKMFIQTSSGYQAVDHFYYKHSLGSDPENNRHYIFTSVHLACTLQRIWLLFSNICHGLLAGLALAQLLFVSAGHPYEWPNGVIQYYSSFAEAYTSSFYCLAIICIVSVFDRIDVCHLEFSSVSEAISFRWIIITMIYLTTIILTLCAESMDETAFIKDNNMTIFKKEMQNITSLSVWKSLSTARSFSAICGWIMIGLRPNEDLLYSRLLEMEKYQMMIYSVCETILKMKNITEAHRTGVK